MPRKKLLQLHKCLQVEWVNTKKSLVTSKSTIKFVSIILMLKVTIKTNSKREILDITELVNQEIEKHNFKSGLVNLFLTHTTASLTTADLDPGTDQDYLDAFEEMIPKLNYQHPHNPSHTPDHILSSLIGTSLTLPVEDGQLVLGTWQRVVLIEFDGSRERQVVLNLIS